MSLGRREIEGARRALLAFYDRDRRDLPWRREVTPYRVLVCEVMAQQTRIETLLPYYERFVRRFYDVRALASADESEVLALWSGLGYYRRARNLHAAARVVVGTYGGEFPRTPEELSGLPGVGEYTAAAVASIACGEVVAAVDGNVERVIARLFDLDDDVTRAKGKAVLRAMAQGLIDPERPGDFNQAVMELGALVCTPREPRCLTCAVAGYCGARKAGTVAERPVKSRAQVVAEVSLVAVVATRRADGAVLLLQNDERGLFARMWLPPLVEGGDVDAALDVLNERFGLRGARRVRGQSVVRCAPFTHVLTHRRLTVATVATTLTTGQCEAVERAAARENAAIAWVEDAQALAARGVPRVAMRALSAAGVLQAPPGTRAT